MANLQRYAVLRLHALFRSSYHTAQTLVPPVLRYFSPLLGKQHPVQPQARSPWCCQCIDNNQAVFVLKDPYFMIAVFFVIADCNKRVISEKNITHIGCPSTFQVVHARNNMPDQPNTWVL